MPHDDPIAAMMMHILKTDTFGRGHFGRDYVESEDDFIEWRGKRVKRDVNKVGRTRKVRIKLGKVSILNGETQIFTATCIESIIESFVTYDVWEIKGLGTYEWYSDHMARAAANGEAIGSIELEPRTAAEPAKSLNIYAEDTISKSEAFSTDNIGGFMAFGELVGKHNFLELGD